MADIKKVIDTMIADGKSDADITAVINHYNKQKKLKEADEDFTAEEEADEDFIADEEADEDGSGFAKYQNKNASMMANFDVESSSETTEIKLWIGLDQKNLYLKEP